MVLPGMEGMVSAAREAAGLELEYIDWEAKYFHTETRRKAREKLQQGYVLHGPPDELDVEMAWLYDEDGKFIEEVYGARDNVGFTPEQAKKLRRGWLIHNHPQNGTFSANDFQFVHRHGLEGIIATTKQGVYKATSKKTHLNLGTLRDMDCLQIFDAWQDLNFPIEQKYTEHVRLGEMTTHEAWANHTEELFEGFLTDKEINRHFEVEFIPWEDYP
jgi:hypothetical protein